MIGDHPDPAMPIEFVRAAARWPLDVLQEIGAIKQVDPDFKERLDARGGTDET